MMMTANLRLYMYVREALDIGKRSLQGFNEDIVSDNKKRLTEINTVEVH